MQVKCKNLPTEKASCLLSIQETCLHQEELICNCSKGRRTQSFQKWDLKRRRKTSAHDCIHAKDRLLTGCYKESFNLFCLFYVKRRLLTRWAAHFLKKGQVPIRTPPSAHTIWQQGTEGGQRNLWTITNFGTCFLKKYRLPQKMVSGVFLPSTIPASMPELSPNGRL